MARLIDADVLANKIMEIWDRAENEGRTDIANFIANIIVPCIVGTPTIEPKQEWISVKDRLPEEGQEVICFCAGNLTNVYTWTGEGWEDSYGYYEDDDIISHWMPMPEPPEREWE